MLKPIPEGDRFADTMKFRRLGEGGGDVLYECWGSAIRAVQKEAYLAGMAACVPDGLSKSDAEFWLANRAKIIAACKEQGFTIVTTSKGVQLMRLGRIEAQK
jgi:hypothetical protein